MLERPLAWLPVSFQRVDADFSGCWGHVGVENFGEEKALGGVLGKATFEQEFATEDSAVVWRSNYKTCHLSNRKYAFLEESILRNSCGSRKYSLRRQVVRWQKVG